MNCHPAYQNLKLEAYLSAPIFVERYLYGTLNFTSTESRANGFSRHKHDLIALMANSIGNYIMLRQKEEELVDLNKRIKRFVGYLAHDLRNPIGSIIGLAQMACKHTITDERPAILGLTAKLLKKHSTQAKSIALVEFYSQKPHG
jgi:signal transduction histidine kinase